jgi:hypothetical protein
VAFVRRAFVVVILSLFVAGLWPVPAWSHAYLVR